MLVGVLTVSAAEENPYGVNSVGCITDIKIENLTPLLGSSSYFTSVVTSHIQGLDERAAIPYRTYGAIGSDETRMFVYSIGSENGLDFSTANVKSIVEAFERENPHWKAVAAINGDFFDIETKITSSYGEPEFPMIQLGDVYKANVIPSATGRGLVGTDADGNMIYYTVGATYLQKRYGTPLSFNVSYTIQLLGEHRNNPIYTYSAWADTPPMSKRMAFLTPDSQSLDLSGTTVYVVKCDTYRRAHVGINGADLGTKSYFIEGEIIDIREGAENESAPEGCILFYTPNPELFKELNIGKYIKCQRLPSGEWADVENAIGFKQQILAEGNILLKNCYGKNNKTGAFDTTLWTEDVYDYPYCWKHRTAIGFREDGTPILLVVEKSIAEGEYNHLGASYYEIGEQLKALGCVNGFLLDGGGSSTMLIRDGEGNLVTAFKGEGSNGRHVANAVILAVRDMSVEPPIEDTPIERPTEKPTEESTEKPTEKPTENPTETPTEQETEEPTDARTEESTKNTDAVATKAPSQSNHSTSNDVADDKTADKKGCGATVTIPVIAVVTVGITLFNTITKKKRK